MQNVSSSENKELVALNDDHLLFTGRPGRVSARMSLSNTARGAIRITNLSFSHTKKLKDLSFPDTLPVNAIIDGSASKEMRKALSLPRTTPPGRYTSKLKVGDGQASVSFWVQEHQQVALSPSRVYVTNVVPGKSSKVTVTLQNLGNMPYTIPAIQSARMVSSAYVTTPRTTVGVADKPNLSAALSQADTAVAAKHTRTLSVKVKEAGTVVQPGKELQLTITLSVPDDIAKTSGWMGQILFEGRKRLSFVLNP